MAAELQDDSAAQQPCWSGLSKAAGGIAHLPCANRLSNEGAIAVNIAAFLKALPYSPSRWTPKVSGHR